MRQGNGAELLGANDPRSANIGIIYVSPTDDRKSVLAAILTQEKLGRKQIAVVLPNQNKAFQRPADFDDLKTVRRKLDAQIIFVTPSGPGPAEFARQRRFAVYSTLESYAKALRDEEAGSGVKKGGWLFNRGKPNLAAITPAAETPLPTPPPTSATPQPPMHDDDEFDEFDDEMDFEDDQDDQAHRSHLAGAAATGAAAVGAGMLAADLFKNSAHDDDPAKAFPATDDDDWDALPPSSSFNHHKTPPPTPDPAIAASFPAQANTGTGAIDAARSPQADSANSGGPKIIELNPVRQKITAKLPPAALVTTNQQPANAPTKSRNGDKAAAAIVGAGAAAAIGAGAGLAAQRVAGQGAQRSGSGGGNFPPPTNPGNRGTGSGRNTKRPRWLTPILILLLLLIILGSVAFTLAHFYPSAFASIGRALPKISPPATVTITPDSKLIENSYLIQGVSGTPNATQRQIAVRSLTFTAKSDPKTVNTTGHTQTAGTVARGQLTFLNGSFTSSYTVGTNTAIPAGNVSLFLDRPAVIPVESSATGAPGTITVPAHASTAGSAGNIGAHAADQACCNQSGNVFVKNFSSFTGGQDAQDYNFVQQSDVDGVANPLKATVAVQAQTSLKAQLHPGEQLVTQSNVSLACTSKVTQDHPTGPQGTNFSTVTVSVSDTCTALAYDQNTLQTMVTNLLQSKAATVAGADYKLAGQIVTQITIQNITQGNISLLANAKGIWVAQLDAQKQALARAIAGKTVQNAQNILAANKEIGHVDIQVNGNVLPSDPSQISIVLQNVAGVQDSGATPTAGVPSPTAPANPPNSTGTATPQPGKGNSSDQGGS